MHESGPAYLVFLVARSAAADGLDLGRAQGLRPSRALSADRSPRSSARARCWRWCSRCRCSSWSASTLRGRRPRRAQILALGLILVFLLVSGRIIKLATDSNLFTGICVTAIYVVRAQRHCLAARADGYLTLHLHILGICGTFMGGIAALARECGHRVTGSDRNVYPPMSTQLAALGIDVIEGYDTGPARAQARRVRGRQRDEPRQSARRSAARQRRALRIGPGMAGAQRAAGPLGARRRRHTRQDDDDEPARRGSSSTRAWRPVFSSAACRSISRSARGSAAVAVRGRGGRVRHGVLRQAREVRALPAAHRGAQQPRARPRRHLSRRRLDPAPVSPADAHRFRRRGGSSSTRRDRHLAEVLDMGCWTPVERFASDASVAADWHVRPDRVRQATGASRSGAANATSARSTGRCSVGTTPRMRWRRSSRRTTRASTSRPRSRRCASSGACVAVSRCAASWTASWSTTTLRIIRRRSRTRCDGVRRATRRRPGHRRARAALEHDEARHAQAGARRFAARARTAYSSTSRPRSSGTSRRDARRSGRSRACEADLRATHRRARDRGAARRSPRAHEQRLVRRSARAPAGGTRGAPPP